MTMGQYQVAQGYVRNGNRVAASAGRIAMLLVAVLVVVAMLVPNTALAFLRSEYSWLGSFVSSVEHFAPGIDMDNLVAFALLGFVARLGLARWSLSRIGILLLSLGIATELAQFWVPGRTPRVSDAALDLVGGLLGFSFAWVLQRLTQRVVS